MSVQKKASKSSVKKINSKNDKKDDVVLSSKDASLLEESIALVTTLSKEVGLVESAKNKLQKDLKGLLNKVEEHEKKHIHTLADKTFKDIKKDLTNQVETLSIALSEQTRKHSKLQSSLLNIKKEVSNDIKNHEVNFTSLESHVKKLGKELSSLKSLVERYENDLFSKKNNYFEDLEKQIKQDLSNARKEISSIKNEKDAENDLIIKRLNSLVDVYDTFENKITSLEKKDFKKLSSGLKNDLVSFKDNTRKELNKKVEDLKDFIQKEVDSFNEYKTQMDNFKNEEHSFVNLRIENMSKELKDFQKKLVSFEDKNFDEIYEKVNLIEKNFNNEISSLSKSLESHKKNQQSQDKELFKRLEGLVDLYKNFEKKFKDFRKEDFDKLSKTLKSDVKEFETLLLNDFIKSFDELEYKFSKTVKENLDEMSSEFKILKADHKDFEEQREEEHKFIDSRLKSLVSQVSEFEEKLEALEKDGLNSISKEMLLVEDKFRKDFDSRYNSFVKEINDSIALLQKENLEVQSKNQKDFNEFKRELASLSKHFTKELDQELNEIKSLTNKFNKEKDTLKTEVNKKLDKEISLVENKITDLFELKKREETYIAEKLNEVIESFNDLSVENKKSFLNFNQEAEEFQNQKLKELSLSIDEKFSKEQLKLNDEFTRLSNSVKNLQSQTNENIDIKFEKTNATFRGEFDSFLDSFNKELKLKEDDFLSKLNVIEKDKELMVEDLSEFKNKIAKLTQEFSTSLHEKLEELQKDKLEFEEKEQRVLDHIDSAVQVKVEEIQKVADGVLSDLPKILEENRLKIENSDNSFRNIFNEKIYNLSSLIEKRLDETQKKLLEKTLDDFEVKADSKIDIMNQLNSQLDAKHEIIVETNQDFDMKIRAFNENIQAREETFEKNISDKFEKLDSKEKDFENNLSDELEKFKEDSEEHKKKLINDLQEKVEERLTNQEQQLNKRFLDLDSQFSSFKGVVVDEVEDTLKEITTFVNEKTNHVDKTLDKLNFVLVEASKKLKMLENFDEHMDSLVQNVRDDINDLRVKFEIMGPSHDHHTNDGNSINGLVSSMSDYENQLVGLISSLKNRGFSDLQIKQALVQKGHPKIYVSMILSYYEED